ncbi:MAG: GAF domain-containing protein [Candidatus Riflebacteria bacterium]|nr:GAF domain-containing protein [Candidatus Riflebacteria bacterium]
MTPKIYLEEICDRENLKTFVSRFAHFTDVNAVPVNERGEALFDNLHQILPGVEDFNEFAAYPASEMIQRPDGSHVKLMKLMNGSQHYGSVLLGPFFFEGENKGESSAPSLSKKTLEIMTEMITEFFENSIKLYEERRALAKKEKILSVLEKASSVMNTKIEFQNLLEFLMDISIDITGAEGGTILLREENSDNLVITVARGKYPQEVKKVKVPIGSGLTGWVAKYKKSLNVPNVLLDPRYIETPESIYSELAVPMVIVERTIGVLVVNSSEINAFTKEDVQTLTTLASIVTKVLENSRLLSDSDQKLRELSKLFTISERLSVRSLDRAGYCDILGQLSEALLTDAASLMLFNSDREELTMRASYGLPEELDSLTIAKGKGYHGWVAAQMTPIHIHNTALDNTIAHACFLDEFSKSLMIIPLINAEERLVGLIGVYSNEDKGTLSEASADLLMAVGRIVTAHLENDRLFNDSRRKLDYLSTLYKVGSSVSKTLNITPLFETILQQVQEVMDVENCSLMAYDSIRKKLTLDAAIGLPSDMVGKVESDLGEGIAGWVAANKKPVLLKDISKDARFAKRNGRLDYKTRSVLSVPILHQEDLLGVLNVNNKRSGDAFFEDDLNLLLGISGQISQAIANASLHEKTDMQVAELSLIQELGKAINSSLDLDSVLNYFIDMTTRITEADKSTLMLFDEETQELYVEASRGFEDENKINDVRLKLGEGIAGQVALSHRPMKLDNVTASKEYTLLDCLKRPKDLTLMTAPLINKEQLIGVINCERLLEKKGPFTPENLDLLDTLASQASIAIENARLYHNLLSVYLETIRSLAAAIDAKDSYTHGHSRRVTEISVGLAMEMNLPKNEVDTIRHASLLHDVGKIGISDKVLLKPGKLTDDEFETIKSHPFIGARILGSIEFLKDVCEIIEHHHERFDGKGYPDKLKGDEIPLGARIICLADSFDAITSCRPYRKPLTFEAATEEMLRCSGTQFDPQVVDAFLRLRTSKYCPPWLLSFPSTETETEEKCLNVTTQEI